jgi:hypothetical protein
MSQVTMKFSSEMWSKEFVNTPGNFTNALEKCFNVGKTRYSKKVGVKYFATCPGFFNCPEGQDIEVYTTTDGINFKYVTSCVITPGYYSDIESLMQHISGKLHSLTWDTQLEDMPLFQTEKVYDEHVVTLHPSVYIDADMTTAVSVCLKLPSIFTNGTIGFSSEQVTLAAQYRKNEIRAVEQCEFPLDVDSKLDLWCSLSDKPLVEIALDNLIINNVGAIPEYVDIKRQMSMTKVNFWFKDKSGRHVNKNTGPVSLVLEFKD